MKDKKRFGVIMLVYVLSVLGVFQLGLLLHESVHVLQSDKASQVCYNFGSDNKIAFVNADKFQANTEAWAYGVNIIFVLIGITLLTIYSKREIDKI
ncbi:MAG TPA: hypothetical protein VMQ58_01970 [Candidatus Saccharimonadales bacterium]|nr:hypothetical protein [Candidatus Saccharimonadales bacterium]